MSEDAAARYRQFADSADTSRFRSPYIPVDFGPPTEIDELNQLIISSLGALSERQKLRWLFDCIEHAATVVEREAQVVTGFLGLARAVSGGQYMPSASFRAQVDKYQAVFEHAVARAKQTNADSDKAQANVLYVLGLLLGYLYRAIVWFETEGGDNPSWFAMAQGDNGFLPLWLVLDGSASARGGIEERRWQVSALDRYR